MAAMSEYMKTVMVGLARHDASVTTMISYEVYKPSTASEVSVIVPLTAR